MVTQIIKINDRDDSILKINAIKKTDIKSTVAAKHKEPAIVFFLLNKEVDICPHLFPPNSAIASAIVNKLIGK